MDTLPTALDDLVARAQSRLAREQKPDGHFVFELEADATIWDPSATALARIGSLAPHAASAEALIASADCVYIASPPASHLPHAQAALAAGKAAFCEKPLAVDVQAARAFLAAHANARAAVNFPMASSLAVATLRDWLPSIGTPLRLEIETSFRIWPRPWQADAAAWLDRRQQGGFTREVVSHFLFLTQRALGAPEILESKATYPAGDGAETALQARVLFGDVSSVITGQVGGTAVADRNLTTVEFERGAIRLIDWMNVETREGDKWIPGGDSPEELRQRAQVGQLDALAAMLAGRAHRLPTVAEGLAVQGCVEGLLK